MAEKLQPQLDALTADLTQRVAASEVKRRASLI